MRQKPSPRQGEFDWAREDRENDLMRMPGDKLERLMAESRRRHEAEVAKWKVRTIALVGCGKTKLPHAARARDLYTGRLFRLASGYAEVMYGEWYVLSAKHKLLNPDKVIEPYEQKMCTRLADRQRWALVVANDIGCELKPGKGSEFVILAGQRYAWPLKEILEARGCRVIAPLANAGGIGCQMSWLARRLEELRLL